MAANRLVNHRILSQVPGVLHIGANIGQERDVYAEHDLNVIWFDANPEACDNLKQNLVDYPKQKICRALLTDEDGVLQTLHITNGYGQASSILEMKKQLELYPDFLYVKDVDTFSFRLDTLVAKFRIPLVQFPFLVIDTQGSDLLVLKGAVNTLRWIQYVEVETSPLEMYKGGCLESEIIEFMESQGYKERERSVLTPGIDNHVLFERLPWTS